MVIRWKTYVTTVCWKVLVIFDFTMEPLNLYLAEQNGLLTRMVDQLRRELHDLSTQLAWLDGRAEHLAEDLMRMRGNYLAMQAYCQRLERLLLQVGVNVNETEEEVMSDGSDETVESLDLMEIWQ